ncbi:eukaryotic translation initiation factor 3 subunit E-like [Zophobas morio]|uniref:eukaryotic translation initiation factor 3 subunit E-like n=1 Tax=Zophobas morio TaxID=2755281 RepID=UPI0030838F7E
MSTNFKKSFSALWGKFATEILTENWKSAHEDLLRIRETLEKKATEFTSVELLNQRSWLIHWSLFVFFNYEKTPEGLVDLLFQSHYLNAIQTACPHILRYLCAAVVLSKRKRHLIGELTRVLEEERGNYDDPLTQFVHYLFVCYDFDEAQKTLRDCETVLRNDFFLYSFQEDFVENARLFIFENYCKVNPRISIKMLAEKLNFDEEKAEVWVVDLICNARLDAKIDCEEGFVIMGSQGTSVYQEVIEKTSRLSNRSHEIVNILTKRITASQKNAIYPLDA